MTSRMREFFKIARESGLKDALSRTVSYLDQRFRIYTSCYINQELPRSTTMPHPTGIVISSDAEIRDNVGIYQNVTIGTNVGSDEYPTIGDDVVIYSGAAIIGDVTIGDKAIIGANSVVIDDVPENTTVVGVPATPVDSGDS